MSPPDARRGPGGPRPESAAAKLTDTHTVPRTSWDGHPSLSVGHDRYLRQRRTSHGTLLLELLSDRRAVLDLRDELGPLALLRIARRLQSVAGFEEVA
jgi:hypothetical protein